jgi:hypothetical protein
VIAGGDVDADRGDRASRRGSVRFMICSARSDQCLRPKKCAYDVDALPS